MKGGVRSEFRGLSVGNFNFRILMPPIITSGSDDQAAHFRPDLRYQGREVSRGLPRRSGVSPRTCAHIGSVSRGRYHIYQNPAQIHIKEKHTNPPVPDARRPDAQDPDVVIAVG
ncbi:pentatricopeptide repeat-containing protein [Dorcoceras hygrometricum]|uniref:Pentatricopeptide repeat-containing protein n=1 Tax=Dorcoceras hygrometricum TaxID=472368 RepID=A0A2Z7DCY8_9LAMI|nr:pentatricopeptide repeat-containing protein [Dorcoceras hygrometricum]